MSDGHTAYLRTICSVCERTKSEPAPSHCATPQQHITRPVDDLFPGNRKDYPVLTGALLYFPHAFAELAKCSAIANEQHNPGEPIHWDYSKSIGDGNELIRHLMDSLGPNPVDSEGIHHDVKVLWRAAETVERRIRRERGLDGPTLPAGEAPECTVGGTASGRGRPVRP